MSYQTPLEDADFSEAVRFEIEAEQARAAAHRADAARSRGVAWSGFGPDPRTPPSTQSLIAAARSRLAGRRAWLASRHGGFLTAVVEGQRAAAAAHEAAESARAAAARDIDAEAGRCRRAAAAMEAHGRRLIAAARRARRAIQSEPRPCA